MKILDLTCNHLSEPLGIRGDEICFGWKLKSDRENVKQKSYRLVIKDAQKIVYDSGIVENSESVNIVYIGKNLKSMQQYFWYVQIETTDGQFAESERASFEIAIANTEWKAHWVEPDLKEIQPEIVLNAEEAIQIGFTQIESPAEERLTPSTLFRKDFFLEKKEIKKARAYVSAHGVYRLEINGKRVDDRLMAPEWTAYQKNILFQTYDVTELLKHGQNTFGAVVADGWWGGRIHFEGQSCLYGNRHALLFQMKIEYDDGQEETVISDTDMKCTEGPYRYSDIFIGEKYDATMKIEEWSSPGLDISEWKDVYDAGKDYSKLHAQEHPPVRVVKELAPKRIFTAPNGDTILDVGQVITGKMRMRISAPRGTIITLQHGEVLDKEGNYLHNILGINKQQMDTYICAGEKEEVFEPEFTFHGFRYVRIKGWIGTPRVENFTALVMATDQKQIGTFLCSDVRLNQLQHNIFWSQLGNFLSIPMDCPQRERDGWTGDIQVFAATALYNQDCELFLEKWLEDLTYEQFESGAVPDVIPFNHLREHGTAFETDASAGWGDAAVILPWVIYEKTGNKEILKKQYASMKKWISYVIREASSNNPETLKTSERFQNSEELQKYSSYLWNTGFHYGDWLVPSLSSEDDPMAGFKGAMITKEIVASGYFANTAYLMYQTAKVLEYQDDAKEYLELYHNICHAFALMYVSEDGMIEPQFQGVYVMALAFGLVPENHREKCLNQLVQMIKDNGGCLDTGFLSVGLILDALTDGGRIDEAYKLLYQDRCPSWLYEVKMGATTMWEAWNAIAEDGTPRICSMNHYAFGSVGDWMYRTILGIRSKIPGYRESIIEPRPDASLSFAKGGLETPYGRLSVEWKKENGIFEIDTEIPCNTTATVILPDGRMNQVGSGKYHYECTLVEKG